MKDQGYGKLDHVGIAVNDVVEVARMYSEGLGLKVSEPTINEDEAVKIVFLPTDSHLIELVQPLHESTAINKFLQTRGEGLHHVCFEVADIEGTLQRLRDMGIQLIDQTPRVDPKRKRKLAFVHPKSAHGVLVELIEYDKPS